MKAFEMAELHATSKGRSPGGWIRLAKTKGTATEPYVIAVRQVATARRVQFGCGCPDWIHRRRHTGFLCKHQRALFRPDKAVPGKCWLFKAGRSFIKAVLSEVRR